MQSPDKFSVGCLTASPPTCKTCTSTLPENTRYNTSCLFKINDKNLLIDCGKTFYPTALRFFPKYKIRRIDALVITHAHADAYFGLDDLRSWTLGGFVQDHIDVYCTKVTLDAIGKTFPYLVNKNFATGGGDVSELRFKIFDEAKSFTIETCDNVEVIPLPVQHGSYFTPTGKIPFWNLGFRIGDVSYISDCSIIPDKTTELVKGSQILVIDGLKMTPHASHFSIEQARIYAKDALTGGRPAQTWITGFSHVVEHESSTEECRLWSEKNGLWVRPAYDGLRIPL